MNVRWQTVQEDACSDRKNTQNDCSIPVLNISVISARLPFWMRLTFGGDTMHASFGVRNGYCFAGVCPCVSLCVSVLLSA